MATISELRTALATNLATIPGLRTSAYVPDDPNPPIAIIEPSAIDFDTTFTKLSADSTGNYFDLYMNGLQPERYYSILIKSIISGSTVVHEDNNYFKVVR